MEKNLCTDKNCPNYNRYSRYCNHAALVMPKETSIPKQSEQMKETLKLYAPIRKKFLNEHPVCEARLEGCKVKAVEIHHKKGKRTRKDYLNAAFFLAVCRHCHDALELSPAFAKANGLSVSRLSKENNKRA